MAYLVTLILVGELIEENLNYYRNYPNQHLHIAPYSQTQSLALSLPNNVNTPSNTLFKMKEMIKGIVNSNKKMSSQIERYTNPIRKTSWTIIKTLGIIVEQYYAKFNKRIQGYYLISGKELNPIIPEITNSSIFL